MNFYLNMYHLNQLSFIWTIVSLVPCIKKNVTTAVRTWLYKKVTFLDYSSPNINPLTNFRRCSGTSPTTANTDITLKLPGVNCWDSFRTVQGNNVLLFFVRFVRGSVGIQDFPLCSTFFISRQDNLWNELGPLSFIIFCQNTIIIPKILIKNQM